MRFSWYKRRLRIVPHKDGATQEVGEGGMKDRMRRSNSLGLLTSLCHPGSPARHGQAWLD